METRVQACSRRQFLFEGAGPGVPCGEVAFGACGSRRLLGKPGVCTCRSTRAAGGDGVWTCGSTPAPGWLAFADSDCARVEVARRVCTFRYAQGVERFHHRGFFRISCPGATLPVGKLIRTRLERDSRLAGDPGARPRRPLRPACLAVSSSRRPHCRGSFLRRSDSEIEDPRGRSRSDSAMTAASEMSPSRTRPTEIAEGMSVK